MSNFLLRSLREAGLITGSVLPFACANAAADLMARINRDHPDKPRAVIVVEAVNSGDYWIVSEEDAARLERAGYQRHSIEPLPQPGHASIPLH